MLPWASRTIPVPNPVTVEKKMERPSIQQLINAKQRQMRLAEKMNSYRTMQMPSTPEGRVDLDIKTWRTEREISEAYQEYSLLLSIYLMTNEEFEKYKASEAMSQQYNASLDHAQCASSQGIASLMTKY